MLVRIENTGLTRGREFSLFAFSTNNNIPNIELYGYNPVIKSVEPITYTHLVQGKFHKFSAIAPSIDGYLLAIVGKQKIIKKIGNPFITSFIYGYKSGYTIPVKLYDKDANIIKEDNLEELIKGFYHIPLTQDIMMVEVRNKFFLINKNISKLNYKITIEGGSLNSNYTSTTLPNNSLPTIKLDSTQLNDATLDSTLPEVKIEEL